MWSKDGQHTRKLYYRGVGLSVRYSYPLKPRRGSMKNDFFITELENDVVLLKQTTENDFNDLYLIGGKQEIWEQHSDTDRYKKSKFEDYFNGGVKNELGCFTIVKKCENKIVGWSRYYSFNKIESSVRIGYTFIGNDYWGTNVNYNTKKLMLDFVFNLVDTVFFDVFSKNYRSQKSVMKLGGKLNKTNGEKYEYILSKSVWFNESN